MVGPFENALSQFHGKKTIIPLCFGERFGEVKMKIYDFVIQCLARDAASTEEGFII